METSLALTGISHSVKCKLAILAGHSVTFSHASGCNLRLIKVTVHLWHSMTVIHQVRQLIEVIIWGHNCDIHQYIIVQLLMNWSYFCCILWHSLIHHGTTSDKLWSLLSGYCDIHSYIMVQPLNNWGHCPRHTVTFTHVSWYNLWYIEVIIQDILRHSFIHHATIFKQFWSFSRACCDIHSCIMVQPLIPGGHHTGHTETFIHTSIQFRSLSRAYRDNHSYGMAQPLIILGHCPGIARAFSDGFISASSL